MSEITIKNIINYQQNYQNQQTFDKIQQKKQQFIKKYQQNIQFAIEIIGGTIGGMASVVSAQPIDTIRVRIQNTNQKLYFMQGLKQAIQNDGFLSLFRGMSSPLFGVPLYNAVLFGSNEIFKQFIGTNDEKNQIQDQQKQLEQIQNGIDQKQINNYVASGLFAGFVQSFVCTPIELCKLSLQMQTFEYNLYNQIHNNQAYKFQTIIHPDMGSKNMAKFIFNNYGIRGLYRGLGVTILREIPSYGAFFGTYEYYKSKFQQKYTKSTDQIEKVELISSFVAGGLAGIAAWAITYPFDVLKSRIQMDFNGRKYTNLKDCYLKSLKQEGSHKFLMQGFCSTMLLAIPQNAFLFMFYELTIKLLNKQIQIE